MDLKKKIKGFFTLTCKANSGFTLVELIVVIAILAILGGVAVPAYSGYVKKTNKEADRVLVSEIEQAMVLAHYNGTLKPGAKVMVKYGEAGDSNAVLVDPDGDLGAEAALTAVFGSSYADLRLKYDGWNAGPAANVQTMTNVENSNFNRNEMNSLLDQVQTVVDAFNTYSVGMTFQEGDYAYEYMKKAGISGNTVTSENSVAFANATVFGVSNQIANILTDVEKKDNLLAYWSEGYFPSDEWDPLTQKTLEYAFTLALAKHADSLVGNGSTTYTDMLTEGVNVDGANNKAVINGNISAVQNAVFSNTTIEDGINEYFSGTADGSDPQVATDALAFLAYMDGVSGSSDSILENNSLYKENFFNDGTMMSYVNSYFDAGNLLQGAPEGEAIALIYNGTEVIFCTPDPDYN